MSLNFVFSVALSWLLGFFAVSLLWPFRYRRRSFIIRCCLAFGCGSGISSALFFFWLCFAGAQGIHFSWYMLFELILVASLGLAYWRIGTRTGQAQAEVLASEPETDGKFSLEKLLPFIFGAVVLFSAGSFILQSLTNPHGQFDAVSIWNMRARFLARGADHWKSAFADSPSLPHIDYPLLLPATIARFWMYVGHEPVSVPAVAAFLFTFSCIGVLWSALALLRNNKVAHLGGIVLLGVNSFIVLGASQYADVVIAFFIVSSLALLALYDASGDEANANAGLLLLAGLTAGLCAWTKNEGLLFLTVLLTVRFVFSLTRKSWRSCGRELMLMIAGALPILIVLIYFKAVVAPENYYLKPGHYDANGPMQYFLDPSPLRTKLTDLSRYWVIAKAMTHEILYFGGQVLGMTPLLVLYVALVRLKRAALPGFLAGAAILCAMMAGYYFVFLTTPLRLEHQLSTALSRLVLQLWPGAVFVLFMGTSGSKGEIIQAQ